MNENITPILGTAASLLVAGLIAFAGSASSVTFGGYSVFFLCAAFAFIIQWIVFIPSFALKTERYFDLTGSLTYLSVTAFALFYGASTLTTALDPRSLLLSALITIWAVRLGIFLFGRIHRAGSDRRFNNLKTSFPWFFMTWTLQGLWTFLTMACALAAMTTLSPQPLGIIAWIGTATWLLGFTIEVVADSQKSAFNNESANNGKFINVGLWRWSRHPNYFGEILLWTGISLIALPVLNGWQWVTIISPLFVAVLLLAISGVPLLERRADKKWGDDPTYQAYKKQTPVILPMPPGKG